MFVLGAIIMAHDRAIMLTIVLATGNANKDQASVAWGYCRSVGLEFVCSPHEINRKIAQLSRQAARRCQWQAPGLREVV